MPVDQFIMAGTHFHGVLGDNEQALATYERLARQAAAEGARLIVAPERALDGCVLVRADDRETISRIHATADTVPGAITQRLGRLARELKAYLVLGMVERAGTDYYNSAVFLAPDGNVIGGHRKTQCGAYEHHSEAAVTCEGNRLDVFDTEFGKVGLLICYERRAPENARVLALKGADLIVILSGGCGPFDTIRSRTRAEENGVFCATVGKSRSVVAGPDGQVLAEGPGSRRAADEPTILTCEINRALLAGSFCRNGQGRYFEHRRPELYGNITKAGSVAG